MPSCLFHKLRNFFDCSFSGTLNGHCSESQPGMLHICSTASLGKWNLINFVALYPERCSVTPFGWRVYCLFNWLFLSSWKQLLRRLTWWGNIPSERNKLENSIMRSVSWATSYWRVLIWHLLSICYRAFRHQNWTVDLLITNQVLCH